MSVFTDEELEIQKWDDWIDEHIQFQMFGERCVWDFRATKDGLILTNRFARNSRTHDFDAELDDWTMLDGMNQTFGISWKKVLGDDEPLNEDIVRVTIKYLVAIAMAHEALEWLREDGEMIHNPHEDGDVQVLL